MIEKYTFDNFYRAETLKEINDLIEKINEIIVLCDVADAMFDIIKRSQIDFDLTKEEKIAKAIYQDIKERLTI